MKKITIALTVFLFMLSYSLHSYVIQNTSIEDYFKKNFSDKSSFFYKSDNMSLLAEKDNEFYDDVESFLYYHQYASNYYSINKKIIIEILKYAKDNKITEEELVILGATAFMESKWNHLALSPDGKDIGIFQIRCKVHKDICGKLKNGRVVKYNKKRYNKKDINFKHFRIKTHLDWYFKYVKKAKSCKTIRGIKYNKEYVEKYDYKFMSWYNPKRQLRIDKIERYIKRYELAKINYKTLKKMFKDFNVNEYAGFKKTKFKNKRTIMRTYRNKRFYSYDKIM